MSSGLNCAAKTVAVIFSATTGNTPFTTALLIGNVPSPLEAIHEAASENTNTSCAECPGCKNAPKTGQPGCDRK